MTYQWKKDNEVIDGATSTSYTITSVAEGDEGGYSCVVSNYLGKMQSNAATLTVNDPVIATHPQSRIKGAGQSVTFSVVADGAPPFSYQWKNDGNDIPGATSSEHTIATVQKSDEGNYTCVVSNSRGTIQSDAAALQVLTWSEAVASAPWGARRSSACVVFNDKLWILGGYNGSSYKRDVWSSSDGIQWSQVTANADWSARRGHTAVVFDNKMWVIGGYDGSNYKRDVWSSSDGLSWNQATASASWSGRYEHTSVVFGGKMWLIGGYDGKRKRDVWHSTDGSSWIQATATASWSGRNSHASVVFSDKMWVIGGYDNSPRKNDAWHSSDGVNWTQATAVAAWAPVSSFTATVFQNKIWIMAGYDGSNPLNQVWYSLDGVEWIQTNVSSPWSSRHSLQAATFKDKIWIMAGYDQVLYKGDVWYAGLAPIIDTHPQGAIKNPGESITFSVAATGMVPLSYQWQKDEVNIDGATSAEHTINSIEEVHQGNYRCLVSNSGGSSQSNQATLTVNDPPTITTQPVSQTKNPGESVSFSVEVTGTPPFRYQWQKGDVDIDNATSAEYSIDPVAEIHQGSYKCVVTNDAGTANSDSATLTVNDPPQIITQPVSQTKNPGESVTFTVQANGTEPLAYQWKKGAATIENAISSSYNIPSVQEANEGNYYCTVTNDAGTIDSDPATLTVNNPPSVTITSPSSGTVFTAPANITITADAADTGRSVSYVEFYQGANLLGSDSDSPYSYTWNNVPEGSYTLTARVVDNHGLPITSDPVNISVNAAPTVTITSPGTGANFITHATIVITADAADSRRSVSYVEFYQGANLLGSDDSQPYSYTWSDVAQGNYALTAKVFDDQGAFTTSQPVNISVNLPAQVDDDFNGDGCSDILWHNTSNNTNAIWLMNGAGMSGGDISNVAFTNSDQVRSGKFDGDNTSDIVVHSPTNANATIYLMNGTQATASQEIASAIDPNQRLVAIGHFNKASDSKSDILWRNISTGANEVWLMDQFTILSQIALPAADLNWQMIGVGDFNGDGHSDLLWRKNTGHNVIWLMNGTTVRPESGNIYTVADFNWKIIAILDIDGDGKSDLFWRNEATGFNVIWLMDGLNIKASGNTLVVPLEWQIVATGCFANSGNILWRKQVVDNGFSIVWKQISSGKPLSSQNIQPQELNQNWIIVGNLVGQRLAPVTRLTDPGFDPLHIGEPPVGELIPKQRPTAADQMQWQDPLPVMNIVKTK